MGRNKRHPNRIYQQIGKPEQGAAAVGYVRYSSDMQNPASIVTQKRRIQEYAQTSDWHIVRWYEEPESSASFEELPERPVFATLLAEAGSEFQIVVCYSNDRWARNVPVAYQSLSTLRARGVWWATADGQWDIDKIQQDGFDIAFAVDTQLNAAFLRRLSKRNIDAKEDRARDGYHNGKTFFGYLPPDYAKAPDSAPSTWRPPRTAVRPDPVTFPALVKIGELAARGWSDASIAEELAEHTTTSPRFGERQLSKDTIFAIRHSWFPREFASGCGHGTIETPSGELVEGRHPSAWPYEVWQMMIEAKAAQFRRPRVQAKRQPHEFSRMLVSAGCRRPLRVQNYLGGKVYYRDTSAIRKLPCPTPGYLSVADEAVTRQFGELLADVHLPEAWQSVITDYCIAADMGTDEETARLRRQQLEDEQSRLVLAFGKGYLGEADLDVQIEQIRSELLALPMPKQRSLEDVIQSAISSAETLLDMAERWVAATTLERRDIVWSLIRGEGLIYDLERWAIIGVIPRPDVLPAFVVGLDAGRWQSRSDGIWLCQESIPPIRPRPECPQPPKPERKLNDDQAAAALKLVRSGKSLREVGKFFGVSYGAIWRLTQAKRQNGSHEGS